MERPHNIVPQPTKVTAKECEIIVRNKLKIDRFKILDFKLKSLDTRNGFLGEHRRLLIQIEDEHGQSKDIFCFAKFLPDTQEQIDFAVMCGVFKKEVFVYDEIFPKFQSCGIPYLTSIVPECYYTKDDYILVFEDVTKKGFQPISKYDNLDLDHVMVTLKSMVKMHASSLIFEDKMCKKLNRNYRLLDEYEKYFYETFYVQEKGHKGGQGVQSALNGLYTGFTLFPEENYDLKNEEFVRNVKELCLDIFELVKPSKKYRNVFCHGDLWTTNIMIKYQNKKPEDCIMLDFQTVRYCPPAHDFMSFMHLTTNKKFRDTHFSGLQKVYYEELQALLQEQEMNLNEILPFEEFLQSCEEQKRFAVVQQVTYVQLTQPQESWLIEYVKDADRWNEALYIDRSNMVIENCKIDPHYKEVFSEALKEFNEVAQSSSKF